MSQDEQYLDLLAIFHYVVGGLTALFACFPIIHLAIGVAIICGSLGDENGPPPAIVGWFFVVVASGFILFGWTLAAFVIGAGIKLKRRISRTFCIVIAGVECIVMPFGTILGVLTLVLLMKDSVKRLFDENDNKNYYADNSVNG